ncbi:hypothetical protein BZG36_04165 [Bifiguratus adelaidae]|uniref:Origin recognition complex subunit 3 n=1 Tax=Bifiguratus adelaidae TaxID=1938954 RepID=A0A261XWA5_9FUNG|nr:hypothetical protein BZG36_04165 [Bifiguratus adelaidae]
MAEVQDSVSEACFLLLPAGKSRNAQGLSHDIPFQALLDGTESRAACRLRQEYFEETWNEVDSILSKISLQVNEKALNELEFFTQFDTRVHSEALRIESIELPTGLVFTGLNMADHQSFFSQLHNKLRSATDSAMRKPLVARLTSAQSSHLKAMLKSMIKQFMDQDVTMRDSGAKDDVNTTSANATEIKINSSDMQILALWYAFLTSSMRAESKPRLVVIVEDFECFEVQVIEDFITICSSYRDSLPFILLFGVATTTDIVHQTLNQSVLCLLNVRQFRLQQAEVWLENLIDQLLIRPTNIKLGPQMYRYILDQFFLHNLSTTTVVSNIKYFLMHHFYGNPLSVFSRCRTKQDLEPLRAAGALTPYVLNLLRMQQSCQRLISNEMDDSPQQALELLTSDALLLDKLCESLRRVEEYHQRFWLAFEILKAVQSCFLDHPSVCRSPRVLYLDALEGGLGSSNTCKWLLSLLRKCTFSKLLECLESIQAHIRNTVSGATLPQETSDVQGQLQMHIESIKADMNKASEESTTKVEDIGQAAGKAPLKRPPPSELPLLEEGRQTNTAKKARLQRPKKLRKWTTLDHLEAKKSSVLDWLANLWREHLQQYSNMPMHEIVYYSNAKLLQRTFSAQPRASIQTALSHPQHYIRCHCCHHHAEDPSNWLPYRILSGEDDICIAYRLYLECGRLINMFDWFTAFKAVLGHGHESKDERRIQARFISSVAELQYMGFIKYTNRKTDHVMRLTWGNI